MYPQRIVLPLIESLRHSRDVRAPFPCFVSGAVQKPSPAQTPVPIYVDCGKLSLPVLGGPFLPYSGKLYIFTLFDLSQRCFPVFYAFVVAGKKFTTLRRMVERHCLITGKLLNLP